jgi:hypothetical protein
MVEYVGRKHPKRAACVQYLTRVPNTETVSCF